MVVLVAVVPVVTVMDMAVQLLLLLFLETTIVALCLNTRQSDS